MAHRGIDSFFGKRPRNSVDSSSSSTPTPIPSPVVPNNSSFEFDLDDIVSDPGKRKLIENFLVNIRDRIRREYTSNCPCQPIGHNYPKTRYGSSMKSFRDEWFDMFDWLEYSECNDAAYCFCCYLFKPTNVSRFGDKVFTEKGFKNWKKALEKFAEHVGGVGSVHHDARTKFEAFKNQRQSVSHVFSSQSRDMEIVYHTRLTASLYVTTLLLRQGLSFRGHDESSTSMNRGNFLEFLDWYSKRNANILKVVNQNAPGNNQNACAVETTLAILNDIGDNLFTILVDESHDNSVKEQMGVILRYVNKFGEVIERFLAVVHVVDTSSQCLKDVIDALFAKHGLSLPRLRGQGYDGASNMRGQFHGLKALILKDNPHAWLCILKEQLQDFRERGWERFLNEVGSFCVANNIEVVNMEDIIKSRTRMKRDGQNVTHYHHYRVEVFCEVADLVIQELHNRFPKVNTDLLLSVACLDPRDSYSSFNLDKLVHLAELYPEDFSWTERLLIRKQLEMYIYDVKKDKDFCDLEDLGSLAKKMIATKKAQVFPLVYRLIELALLSPVATASVDRIFSAMNIVKTDLRNRMGDEWMNDRLVVYIEKEVFARIDNEVILRHFQICLPVEFNYHLIAEMNQVWDNKHMY